MGAVLKNQKKVLLTVIVLHTVGCEKAHLQRVGSFPSKGRGDDDLANLETFKMKFTDVTLVI